MTDQSPRGGVSRRRLLGRAGVAAGTFAALPVLTAVTPAAADVLDEHGRPGAPHDSGEFGRLFPDLEPFADSTDKVRSALIEVGIRLFMEASTDGVKHLAGKTSQRVQSTHPLAGG